MKNLTTAVSLLLALSFVPATAAERPNLKKAVEQQIVQNQAYVDMFVSRAAQGFYDTVKKYINQGIDVNAKASNGRTALIAVAAAQSNSSNYLKIGHVATLLVKQKDIDLDVRESGSGKTALMYASQVGNSYIANLLLNANAPVDRQDYRGNTPLFYAAQGGKANIVKKILKVHPELIDLPNYEGQTPMMEAAKNGYKAVVQVLANECAFHVCDINEKNNAGYSARMIAEEAGYKDIVDVLDNAAALAQK